MAKQLKILQDKTPKKRQLKLRDLAPRKQAKGGTSKSPKRAGNSKSAIPKSLEEFLHRDSRRID
jgi:hypothetical protein